MATIKTQNWSAGNEVPPMQTAGYGPSTGTAGYPDVYAADEVEVSGGRLQWWTGGPGDWQNAAWEERDFGSLTSINGAGRWDATEGNVEIPFQVVAQAMADTAGGLASLFYLRPNVGIPTDYSITVSAYEQSPGSDTWILEVGRKRWNTSPFFVTTATYTFSKSAAIGTDKTLRVCWRCATVDWAAYQANPSTYDVPLDGYMLVQFGGATAYEFDGIDFYVYDPDTSEDGSELNWARGYGIGAGLIGSVGTITITDEGCYTPVEDVSDPCCADGDTTPGPGQTGDIPTVDPYSPYNAPPENVCTGGGVAPSVADLTDTEDWTVPGMHPEVWADVVLLKAPAYLGADLVRWGSKPISTGATFVQARVPEWYEIRRALCPPEGSMEIGRFGARIDEQDAVLRSRLAEDPTSYLLGREITEYIRSEQGRRDGVEPRVLARGYISNPQPDEDRTYAVEAEDASASPYGLFDLDKLFPPVVMDYDLFPPGRAGEGSKGLHKDLVGQPIPFIIGPQSDANALASDGTTSAAKGKIPCIWTGDTYLPGHGTQVFGELLVGFGAFQSIEAVFASDVGYDSDGAPADPPRAPRRVRMDDGVWGVDFFGPGKPGWPFARPYITRLGIRMTAIYARGPRMDHHREGLITITVNACPQEDVGDGTGNIFDQAGPAMVHTLNQAIRVWEKIDDGNEGPDPVSANPAPIITVTQGYGAAGSSTDPRFGYGDNVSSATPPTSITLGQPSGGTLVNGKTYYVSVASIDASGKVSNPYPLLAAQSITMGGTGRKITVSWSGATGASSYRVVISDKDQIDRSNPGLYRYKDVAGTSTEFTSESDGTNEEWNILWWYIVTALYADGESVASYEGFGYKGPSWRARRVEWQAAVGAIGYRVYRRGTVGVGRPFSPPNSIVAVNTYDRAWDVDAGETYFDDDLMDTGDSLYYLTSNESSFDWGPIATFPTNPNVPAIQTSTFEAFQDYTADKLATVKGYLADFQIRERITIRELLHRFSVTWDCWFGFNHHGQLMLAWVNDLALATDGTLYRERMEIDGDLPPYLDGHDEIENIIRFQFDYDHDLQQWRREPEVVQDDVSIAAQGARELGQRLQPGETATPIECLMSSDAQTVRSAMGRRLLRKKRAPRYQEVPSDLRVLENELGDQFRVTHTAGVGANGYEQNPFFLIEHRVTPGAQTQGVIRGLDLYWIVQGLGAWASEAAAADWDSASASERAANWYWADESGKLPTDGSPGKEWR